jgi:sugar fermentation stimulation protein
MKFDSPLIAGKLIKRYKRFLADVELPNGVIVTAHCTNSGSMKSCIQPGADVLLSKAADPNRKTHYTWEQINIDGCWIGINTMHPNFIVWQALCNDLIAGLTGYTDIRREVTVNDSRLDIVASNSKESAFIEVKNVTYKDGIYARFPDAVTSRGLKHLHNLMRIKQQGDRAVMVYVIQRNDVSVFAPAFDIDPKYADALSEAYGAGVEIYPIVCRVSPDAIEVDKIIPFDLKH